MDWTGVISTARRLLEQPGLTVQASWRGGDFSAVRTLLKRQDVNSDAGLLGAYQFSLLASCSVFGEGFPSPRVDKITIDGQAYRVLALEQDAVGALVRIHLGGEYE